MKTNIINIDQEQNPQFFALIEENRSITIEYNRINLLLVGHRVPTIFLFHRKKKLLSIGKQAKELHEKFLKWDDKVYDFLVHPQLAFQENVDGQTSFFHYMDVLREVRRTGKDGFDMLLGNYNRIYDRYSTQLNFLIAIFSCLASLGGLLASLFH